MSLSVIFLFWDPLQSGLYLLAAQGSGEPAGRKGTSGRGPWAPRQCFSSAGCAPNVPRHVEGRPGKSPSNQSVTSGQAFDMLLLAIPCNEENRDNTDESLILLILSK